MERYTKRDFDRDFPDDEACLRWIWAVFYPDEKLHCVKCLKQTKHYRVKSRPSFSCSVCGHHVHPMAGRIYEKSRTSLRTWFYAVFLMSTTRTGVSAKWLQRSTGVTYKTAWRMFREIRSMLDEGDGAPLRGLIEVDETYIGGRRHGQGRGAVGKAVVVGLHERGGRIIADVVPDVKRRTLGPVIEHYVEPGSGIFTDELMTYGNLGSRGFIHASVNHKAKKWVVDGNRPREQPRKFLGKHEAGHRRCPPQGGRPLPTALRGRVGVPLQSPARRDADVLDDALPRFGLEAAGAETRRDTF